MNTDRYRFIRNFLACLSLLIVLSACTKTDDSSSGIDLFSSDQTQEAVAAVSEANDKLKQIKKLFNENEGRLEELKAAMNNKDAAKVKEISNELVYQINNGTKLGEEAIEKIESVQEMSVNDDFKTYLSLKTDSLRKYVEAFEERRQLAILLRDRYDPKNEVQRTIVVDEFNRREEKFKKIMEEARESSDSANQLAKESSRKSN